MGTEPLTDAMLAEWDKTAMEASPPPWTVDEGQPFDAPEYRHIEGWTNLGDDWMCLTPEDARFIAAARKAVPALVAEVRKLRGMVERLARFISQTIAAKNPCPPSECPQGDVFSDKVCATHLRAWAAELTEEVKS